MHKKKLLADTSRFAESACELVGAVFESRRNRMSPCADPAPCEINNLLIQCSNYKQGLIDYTAKIQSVAIKIGPEWSI